MTQALSRTTVGPCWCHLTESHVTNYHSTDASVNADSFGGLICGRFHSLSIVEQVVMFKLDEADQFLSNGSKLLTSLHVGLWVRHCDGPQSLAETSKRRTSKSLRLEAIQLVKNMADLERKSKPRPPQARPQAEFVPVDNPTSTTKLLQQCRPCLLSKKFEEYDTCSELKTYDL